MAQLAVRFDEPATIALERLVQRHGRGQSQIIREAVIEYEKNDLLAMMRAESESIRNDPRERAESDQVLADMRSRRAW